MKKFLAGLLLTIGLAGSARATEYVFTGPTVAVSGATSATPISVTTATHSYVTGDVVTISGVEGNTCANGDWKVTVTSATVFTLDGSVGVGCGTYSGGSNDTSTLKGKRATGASSWYDTSNAAYVRIYIYGSGATVSTTLIQASANAFAVNQDGGSTPINAPAFTVATITDASTTGEYWFVAGGRIRVNVSAWTSGTVYATIEAYGNDGRRIY